MNWIRHLSLQAKLAAGLAAVILLLTGLTILGFVELTRQQRAQELLDETVIGVAVDLERLRSNLHAERLIVALLLESPATAGERAQRGLRPLQQEDKGLLQSLTGRYHGDAPARAKLGEIASLCSAQAESRETELLPLLFQGRAADARDLFAGAQASRFDRINTLIRELQKTAEAEEARLVTEGSRRAEIFAGAFLTGAAAAVAASILMAVILGRLVTQFAAERRRTEGELRRVNRTLRALSACNEVLVRAATEPELLNEICRLIVAEGGYPLAWIGFTDEASPGTLRCVAQAGSVGTAAGQSASTRDDATTGRDPAGVAVRTGKPAVCRNLREECSTALWSRAAVEVGCIANLALPLQSAGKSLGALSVYAAEPGAFDDAETELLAEMASDVAFGVMALRSQAERVRAEQALHAAESSLREAQHLAHLGNWDLDLVSSVLWWSEEIFRIFEVDPSVFRPSYEAFLGFIHPDDRDWVNRAYTDSVRNRTAYNIEHRLLMKDGRVKYVNERCETHYAADGRPLRSIGTVQDVTERRLAEINLRQRNRELTLVNRIVATAIAGRDLEAILDISCRELAGAFDVAHAGVALLNEDRTAATIVSEHAAPGSQPVLGSVQGEPASESLLALLSREWPRALLVADAGADTAGEPARAWARRRGLASVLVSPLITGNEVRGGLVLATREPRRFTDEEGRLAWTVAGELAAELARVRLGEIHRRLTTAIEQSPESVIVTDAEAHIVYVNPAFERLTGYARAEVLGRNPSLLKSGRQDAEFYRELWSQIGAGQVWHGRLINKRKDGTQFTEDSIITPVRDGAGRITNYVATKRDITRELQLEAQFLHAQKMEAFGQLAGGVAHDFNNILAVIMMHLSLLQLEKDVSPKLLADFKELENDAQRAANLTRQLLMFSRRHMVQKQALDLNQVLGALCKMLRRILGENIAFTFTGGDRVLPVEADAGMMEQVVMNLCVNARDAMPKGGQITIETRVADPAGREVQGRARTGPHACLSVTDTGSGMDAATLRRLFEPFFTTKAAGKGTGLGLATVHGIVEQHDGWVEVESEVGRGSTFRVYLPAYQAPMQARAPAGDEAAPGGTESILLVEDEGAVRQILAKALLHHGYQVVAASNGVEALRKWEEQEHHFDLLLTDMVMPEGVTGIELAEQLTRAKPGLKVMICSGYAAKVKDSLSPVAKSAVFLPKPFELTKLLQTVRHCLDAP